RKGPARCQEARAMRSHSPQVILAFDLAVDYCYKPGLRIPQRHPTTPMRAMQMLQRKTIIAPAAGLLWVALAPARAADISPNETARLLGGMPPAAGAPLAALTRDPAWQQHADAFDAAFGRVEQTQLAHIRAWSNDNLPTTRPTLFYFFSGPDFLYAN